MCPRIQPLGARTPSPDYFFESDTRLIHSNQVSERNERFIAIIHHHGNSLPEPSTKSISTPKMRSTDAKNALVCLKHHWLNGGGGRGLLCVETKIVLCLLEKKDDGNQRNRFSTVINLIVLGLLSKTSEIPVFSSLEESFNRRSNRKQAKGNDQKSGPTRNTEQILVTVHALAYFCSAAMHKRCVIGRQQHSHL